MRPPSLSTIALTALPFVISGCVETEPLRADAPTPPVVAPPSPAPTTRAPVTHAPTLPPLSPDLVPAHLGTHEASRAAMPWWGDKLSGYAPQTAQPWSFFDAAERAPREIGPLSGEMLACAVGVVFSEQKFSPFSGDSTAHGYAKADLTSRIGFGAHLDVDRDPLLLVNGPEDRNEMRLTAPVVDLHIGDPIVAQVLDRDVFSNNKIDLLRGRFDGKIPIVLRGKRAAMECRLVPRALVEASATESLALLDAAIAKLDVTYSPRLDETVHFDRYAITDVTKPFRAVAALVGWDDPRLAVRKARMATLEKRFDDELKVEMTRIHAAQPPPGTWLTAPRGNRAVRLTSFECGDKVRAPVKTGSSIGCLVHLEVKNLAATPEDVVAYDRAIESLDLDLLDGSGRRRSIYFLGRIEGGVFREPEWRQRHEVLPNATTELLYRLPVETFPSETYFNGVGKPFEKNVEAYEPVMIELRDRIELGKVEVRYLRVK